MASIIRAIYASPKELVKMGTLGMEPTASALREWSSIPSLAAAPTATRQIELWPMENVDAQLHIIPLPQAAAHVSPTAHTTLLPEPVSVSIIMRYSTVNAS